MTFDDRIAPWHRLTMTAMLGAFACAGCSSPGDTRPVAPVAAAKSTTRPASDAARSRAEAELHRAIRSYEDADYEIATRKLQAALDRGLKRREDQATAYKYLAFVSCTSGRIKVCQAEFRNALEADPRFELGRAEAGHPIWGPVFRTAKADFVAKAGRR